MVKRFLSFLAAGLLSLTLVAKDVGVTVNGVDVSAASGTDWSYTSPMLTLLGAGPFVLHGTNTDGAVQVKVTADSTVVLSNLYLRANGTSQCAFQIVKDRNVALLLVGENKLQSGSNCAGLQVPAGASVCIDQAYAPLRGFLRAHTGSSGGAGIGGPVSGSTGSGDVHVKGGCVSAEGGSSSAGIGGSQRNRGSVGKVFISGGTVYANFGDGGESDIGGNSTGGGDADVAITGGSVHAAHGRISNSPTNALGAAVHCVTVTGLVANAAVELKDLGDYGDKGIFADDDGQVYLWLTNGVYKFQAGGCAFRAEVNNGSTEAEMLPQDEQPIGVFVNGEDIGLEGSGEGWEFTVGDLELSLTGTGPFILSGTNTLSGLKIATPVDARPQVTFNGFSSANLQFLGALEIVGGTVAVAESQGPLIITGGSVKCENENFAMPPSNGVERVWCVTVPNLPPHVAIEVTGLADYGTEGLVADADGCLYLWLPDGDYIFEANGNGMRAIVEGADVVAVALPEITPTGVTVNGVDAAYEFGPGWIYTAPVLALTNAYDFVLSGTNMEGAVQVSVEANVQVVVSNLVLSGTDSGGPFGIKTSCEVELVLEGANKLTNTGFSLPGLYVPVGAKVTIRSYMGALGGNLSASGGALAAGIGGAARESSGEIFIEGGTIRAVGGEFGGMSIGDGAGAAAARVTISGGSIKADKITSPPVNEQGTTLFCVTVPGLAANAAVTVTGLTGYGTDGLVADETGQIYLWLPNGERTFTAGDRKFTATVNGAAVTATDQGPATEVVLPTELVITSFSIANGVASLGIATDLSDIDFAAWLSTVSFEIDFREEIGGAVVETLTPTRAGTVLTVTLPSRPQGFLVVRALNR